MDRFGRDTDIRKQADGGFKVRIKCHVSGQFFGWLAGLGNGVKIAAPEEVKGRYKKWLSAILEAQEKS